LYGQKWVSPESVQALQIYTLLLSVLGINGIMEAFLFAKASKEFKLYKYVSLIPTAIYIFLSFYFINFLNLGTGSFFLANTISMMIRILISWNMEVKKHISLR
jgi:O-antigen/teichoic acid export membrane protein